jgi:Tfp pilus assembly protein PilW
MLLVSSASSLDARAVRRTLRYSCLAGTRLTGEQDGPSCYFAFPNHLTMAAGYVSNHSQIT